MPIYMFLHHIRYLTGNVDIVSVVCHGDINGFDPLLVLCILQLFRVSIGPSLINTSFSIHYQLFI